MTPFPNPSRPCPRSGCACHGRQRALPALPAEMARRRLRSEVKQRAYIAREEDAAARGVVEYLGWTVPGPDRHDDGGETCPWCERPGRPGTDGLCGDCAGLERATTTQTTERRMISRIGWRARRGELDAGAYQDALWAHRGRG